MEIFENDRNNAGFVKLEGPVKYSAADEDCVMYVACPWDKAARRPLVVFVQGSGWTHPNPFNQLPQLCALAREKGYVCASVVHRDCRKGNPFPAYLQDVKCAIRFLRARADRYRVDPSRVGIWGTSSGGNTALLAGVTGDAPEFKTDEYKEVSDSVNFVVDCFGPSDLTALFDISAAVKAGNEMALGLTTGQDPASVGEAMSPIRYVKPGHSYPPMLILGGDSDNVVPFSQSESMYNALNEIGSEAYLVKVAGAEHEGSFWSEKLLKRIADFIDEKL